MIALPSIDRRKWIIAAFFIALLGVGLFGVRDYGIPYDEGTMDSLGHDAYAYVFEGKPWPVTDEWRYHGTVVELPLYALVRHTCDTGSPCAILVRHAVDFLLFFLGVVCFYVLARKWTGDWKHALLGCLMLVLSPRIFASAFYNSRDIPTMTFFILSMYTLLLLAERKTYRMAVLHGAACALALSTRMTGILLPVLTAAFLCLSIAREHRLAGRHAWSRTALLFAAYVCALTAFTVAFWPFLWEQPLAHFVEAYRFMSSLNGSAWFMGRTLTDTPWYYVPVWIAVSTPPLYTLLFIAGTAAGGALLLRPSRLLREPHVAIAFAWFFLPLLAILLTGAGLYTEWRHVFFIYPAFILLALLGLRSLGSIGSHMPGPWLRHAPKAALAVQLALTGTWMLQNHPFQHSYFALNTPAMARSFGVDAWELSYLQAVEFVHRHDRGDAVSFYASSNLANLDSRLFFPEDRDRVFPIVRPEFAQYLIDHYRPDKPSAFSGRKELYSAVVDGVKLVTVYRGDFDPSSPEMVRRMHETLLAE